MPIASVEKIKAEFPSTALAVPAPAGSPEENLRLAAGLLALAYLRARDQWKRGVHESMTIAVVECRPHLPYLPRGSLGKATTMAAEALHETHGRTHGLKKGDYQIRIRVMAKEATMDHRATTHIASRHLTPEQVRFIRAEHVPGRTSLTNVNRLAELFEVTPAVVYALLSRRTYRHVK